MLVNEGGGGRTYCYGESCVKELSERFGEFLKENTALFLLGLAVPLNREGVRVRKNDQNFACRHCQRYVGMSVELVVVTRVWFVGNIR
jgi:hypothetical protein